MVVVLIFVGSPPYRVLGVLIHNDELILRRTSCVYAGKNINCTELAHLADFIACKAGLGLFFKQSLVRRIVDNLCRAGDTILGKINCCHLYFLL